MITPARDDHDHAPTRAPVGPDDPAALALTRALAEGFHWIEVNSPKAREADPKGIHRLRNTSRRLRSVLRLFQGLTDPGWSDPLAAELKWLADVLGVVRDLDVLTDRLQSATLALGEESAVALHPLFDDLAERRRDAVERLREAMTSERYAALRESDQADASALTLTDEANEPCREVLPPRVAALWKDLKRRGRALEPSDPDEAFHSVRKQVKRVRLAAEMTAEVLDPGPARAARRFPGKLKQTQDVLGAHQDATIAESLIREAAEARPELGRFNLAAGRLIERESRASTEARARFFQVWLSLDRKKSARWLRV